MMLKFPVLLLTLLIVSFVLAKDPYLLNDFPHADFDPRILPDRDLTDEEHAKFFRKDADIKDFGVHPTRQPEMKAEYIDRNGDSNYKIPELPKGYDGRIPGGPMDLDGPDIPGASYHRSHIESPDDVRKYRKAQKGNDRKRPKDLEGLESPHGNRGEGPSVDDFDHTGAHKNPNYDMENSPMSQYSRESFPENQMYGVNDTERMNDEDLFRQRFNKLFEAYTQEPGISDDERARRLELLKTEQMQQANHPLGIDKKTGKRAEKLEWVKPEHTHPISHEKIVDGDSDYQKSDKKDSKVVSKNTSIKNIKGNVHISKHLIENYRPS